jgi:hypothetical protein
MSAQLHLRLGPWAEDEDLALRAAQEAWSGLDSLLVGLLVLGSVIALVAVAVAVLRQPRVSRRRRALALALPVAGCAFLALLLSRMGVVWLLADPREGGGPAFGSGTFWIWCLWLAAAAVVALASIIAAFVVVGIEDP